jgi:hypothetical protein
MDQLEAAGRTKFLMSQKTGFDASDPSHGSTFYPAFDKKQNLKMFKDPPAIDVTSLGRVP